MQKYACKDDSATHVKRFAVVDSQSVLQNYTKKTTVHAHCQT